MKDNGFVRIVAKDFFGRGEYSPNGRFLLAWRDQSTFVEQDGTHRVTPGQYLLYEGAALRAEGTIDRPNDGKVADDGRFIFNDWAGLGDLAGTFYAFAPDGRVILRRAFAANLYNNGLSADGRLAVCQTCNAPESPDSSILTVFDLDAGREIYGWDPRSGWASAYAFSEGGEEIALSYQRGGIYHYALDGTFLDEARWRSEELRQGSIWVAKAELAEHGATLPADVAQDMVFGFQVRLAESSLEARDRALILRLFGECREAQRDPKEALRLYQEALAHDPKVGVKRKVEQMLRNSVDNPNSAGQ